MSDLFAERRATAIRSLPEEGRGKGQSPFIFHRSDIRDNRRDKSLSLKDLAARIWGAFFGRSKSLHGGRKGSAAGTKASLITDTADVVVIKDEFIGR